MHRVYLLLGSNIGDRMGWLRFGIDSCRDRVGRIVCTSHLYQTAPWGKTDQAPFLNQAVLVESTLSPGEVLHEISGIEENAERQRKDTWGPRTLDIDILIYDDLIIDTEELTLPHPRLHKRNFALVPLAEIAPDVVHPLFHLTISEMLKRSEDHSEVSILPR